METIALTFGSPLCLWGLLALPVFAGLYIWSHLRGRALVGKVVASRLRDQLAGSVSVVRRILRGTFVVLALGLTIVALAQPRYGFTQQEIKQKGRDIIVAVDTSRSMLATDIAPNRLTRAKLLTQDLIRLLKGDRIGLVAFAGSSFLQAPLTLDYSAVINALDELDTTVIPKGGTNIASAIATAEQAFGKAEGQTRALVILTDGEELDADGVAAAKKAAEHGVRIFTVGIGSLEGSLIPFRSEDGKQDFVRDIAGKPVQTRLDEARLSEIAKATGGFFVLIGPDAAREIFQQGIEPMDTAETGIFSARQPLERYQWPLGFAIGFLILWLLIGERRRSPMRRMAALVALVLTPALHASPTGLEDYKAGNYDKARQLFEQRLKTSPEARAVQFDAGASAYKMGDFEQAISHFTGALLSEDKKLREDASYNLANALVRRGEAAKENEAKKTDWKNAIEHYNEALNMDAKNKQAKENRDLVKKLLEDLEKQEQQKKQDDKKDQKKDDQKDQKKDDKKDQEKKDKNKDQKDDQQKQDQQKKDEQDKKDQQDKQDQKGGKDDQKKDGKPEDEQKKDGKDSQDKKDQPDQNGEKKDEQKKPGDQQKANATPTPTPGEKKEGDVKAAGEKKEEKPEGQGQQAGAEEPKDGEMSAAQARALLKSLNSEEEKVNLMQQSTSQEVLRDW